MQKNHLQIGGINAVDLAKRYGTPLFVYDVNLIRERARSFTNTFEALGVNYQVAYASKAFSSIAMLQVAKQENLSLDVVSEGELYTAIKAGFPSDQIHMHGNNKSKRELEMAVENDIGCIVVDNYYEIELLNEILNERQAHINVLLRVTPGIEAHTHDYILTGQEDSKFGFDLISQQADEAMEILLKNDRINVLGVHCHIGSQIFETQGFVMAVRKIYETLSRWYERYNFESQVINLGGGFGIRYTDEDEPLPLNEYVVKLVEAVKYETSQRGLNLPEIWIEPGRSIVGEAGTTLYTVGSIKQLPGVRKYVSVDGGMTDNIRPALYQAKYQAVIANKLNKPIEETVSIAGKCCESGDMLIWDLDVPSIESGDIIAVSSTGAYGYSMANHYNRFSKPAVVFVENGKDQLVVRRETYQDVVANDLSYE